MFAVYELNGKPDYMAINTNDSCCEAVTSCFPCAICHHQFSSWAEAKHAINTITSRTELIEPLLRLALRGNTFSETADLASEFALSAAEAQILFGHRASHTERLAMFNVLLQGGRVKAESTTALTSSSRFQLEFLLLQ